MKDIYSSSYDNNSVGLTKTNGQIIDNSRPPIIRQIIPYSYCSMCGGTGRCGGACIG